MRRFLSFALSTLGILLTFIPATWAISYSFDFPDSAFTVVEGLNDHVRLSDSISMTVFMDLLEYPSKAVGLRSELTKLQSCCLGFL